MPRTTASVLYVCVMVAGLTGCATVDPRADYERLTERVNQATGGKHVYQPQREDQVRELVEALCRDGITAAEAVEISLLNNAGLQAAFMRVGMARADVVQAGLFSNPFIGISARFPDGGGLANIDAGISQNIAELWQIPVRTRAAQRSLDAAILDLAQSAAGVAADAKTAYYEAVGADERLRIARDNQGIADNFLTLALARQEAGAANELDVNLSRGVAVDAEIEVAKERLSAAQARRRLATVLGLTVDADALVLADPLPTAFPQARDTQSLVERAKAKRLDLQAARQSVAAAHAQLEHQHRLVFPLVEIGLDLEREARQAQGGRDLLADTLRASIANGSLTVPDVEPPSARRPEHSQDVVLGPSLGIELPIFDQNQAQIAKAEFALQQARKSLDALDRAVTQQVRGAVDRAMTAWRLVRIYRDRSIPLAQENLDLSHEAYRAGRASFLSVLEAQRFYLETRRGYVQASQSAATMIPELERTIGLPLDAFLPQVDAGSESELADQENGS